MNSKYAVGIDEVGRGPLAGPITFCAVKISETEYRRIKRLQILPRVGLDSKKIKADMREVYARELKYLHKEGYLEYSIVHISEKVIDTRGLSFAIAKALRLCVARLDVSHDTRILLDGGLKLPSVFTKQKTIIKGDEKEQVIAWASILAKVERDGHMKKMAKKYPEYGFEKHMGYGTFFHRQQIKKHGQAPIHRKSFLKNILKISDSGVK
jgi:ribonuclease HII